MSSSCSRQGRDPITDQEDDLDDFITSYPLDDRMNKEAFNIIQLRVMEGHYVPYDTYNDAISMIVNF